MTDTDDLRELAADVTARLEDVLEITVEMQSPDKSRTDLIMGLNAASEHLIDIAGQLAGHIASSNDTDPIS